MLCTMIRSHTHKNCCQARGSARGDAKDRDGKGSDEGADDAAPAAVGVDERELPKRLIRSWRPQTKNTKEM